MDLKFFLTRFVCKVVNRRITWVYYMRPIAAINTLLSLNYVFFPLSMSKSTKLSVDYGLNYNCKNQSRRRIAQNTSGSLCPWQLIWSSNFQHLASVKWSVLLTFKKFPMLIQVEAGEIQSTDDKCDEKTLQGCSRERIWWTVWVSSGWILRWLWGQ